MRSGSETMSRTVIRGFSDAYGSWKTICISRRTSRICRRLKRVISRPLKMIFPAVGSTSLISVRDSVVFPQPGSPTRPSVSPAMIERPTAWSARVHRPAPLPRHDRAVDAVDRMDLPDGPLHDPGLDREGLVEALDAQDLLPRP